MRNRSRLFLLCLSLASFVLLVACGGGGGSHPIAVALSQTSPQTLQSGGTLTVSVTVSNDSSNRGATWSISPATGCGTLSGSGTSAVYTAPQSSSLTTSCTATITAASVADPSKSASVQITVNPISVSISGATQRTATAGGAVLPLTATLANDPANGGITWSLAPASGCGSLSSSGTSATYTPPAASANAACTVTVTATSVSDASKKGTITINVTLPAITLSLSPGTSQALQAGGTLPLTATVGNDFGNKGVSWSVNPATGCGTVSSSGTSATYTAPTALASACAATITATSVADTSKTASVVATVNPISVTMSPGSAQTVAPSQTLPLTGTLSNDGTNSGLNWSISPASSCGNLSATTGTAVTYTAPVSIAAQCTATITVASTADSSKTASLAVTVNPIAVTLSPVGPLSIGQGALQSIQATVSNDIASKGVSWNLTGCGSFSGESTASATYNAPTALASACTATVTATSVTDNSKTASVQVTVNPITISISPNTAQNLFAGATLPLSATLSNDGANKGLSWSLNPATGCGSLAGNSGNSNSYIAPTVLASQCTATVTVSSVTDNTKTAQVNIAVNPAIVVSLSPSTSQTMWAGNTLQITPTVSNDNANQGVNLTLSPASGCGTLSSSTAASGTPVTYSAPASLSSQCTATVTATSISDNSKLATLNITVNPAIAIALAPSTPQFLNAGKTLQITPTVSNDSSNQGANLALSPATGCGTLSSSSVQSGTAVTYSAPTTLSNSCSVTLTATSVADSTKSATLNITVNPAIVVTLSPNTQQYLDGGGTLQITPTVSNDAANAGVNFALNPTTGCGSITPANSVASGTATTYTAPSSLSTPCSVTVTATSVTDSTKSATVTVSVNLPMVLPSPNPSSLGSATVGGNYQGSINVAGGYGSYTWAINGTTVNTNGTPFDLGNGLSATNTGGNTLNITGTPASANTVSFQVTVKDSTAATAGPFTYSITANNPTPLTLPTPSPNLLPTAIVGGSYQAYINAQGGLPNYTFTVNSSTVNTNGTLLDIGDGLSVSNTGGNSLSITGTPASATTVNIQVSVKDSIGSTAGPYTYSINVSNPTPLQINTSQQDIGNGLVGTPYSTYIDVSGGSGNNSNYQFSYTGTLPPGLALGGSNCNSCIAGTPTTAGSYSFTIKVTDSSIPGSQATAGYTINIATGPDGTQNHLLYGHYAFLFQGSVDDTNNNGGPLYQTASIGTFYADGAGNISNVQFHINDGSGTVFVPQNSGVTGTYSIGPDNRGIVKLNACVTGKVCNTAGSGNEFTIAVGQIENVSLSSGSCPNGGSVSSCPVYTNGHLVEFDDTGMSPSGVNGSAQLFRQSLGQFDSLSAFQSSVTGNWVFGNKGEDTSHVPLTAAGIFDAQAGTISGSDLTGSIGSGLTDINDGSTYSSALTLSGADTYNASTGAIGSDGGSTTNTGNFVGTLTVTNAPVAYPTNFVFYMINSNRLLGMSWDSHVQDSLIAGILYKQQASHTSMPGKAVMYITGAGTSSSHSQLLQATCVSSLCTVNSDDDNDSGTYTQNQNPPAGTQFSANVDANGRVTLTGAGNHAPVFYIYDSSATGGAVLISTSGPDLGELKAQGTVPTTISALAGTSWGYYMGTLFSMVDTGSDSGTFTADSSGIMTGFNDNGGQGYASYGNSMSGMNLTVPDSHGVFYVQAGGQNQVVCYVVTPPCSGGGTACGGSSTPYASYACMDTSGSNNPKVTIVQQVQ